MFANFDQNKNGKLSEQEFVHSVINGLYHDFDLNNDGKVTKKEFFQHSKDKKQAKVEYPKLDPQNKGFISLDSVKKFPPLIDELKLAFKQLDSQGKGFVTLKDLQSQ
ncbi:EF-hand domain-containing protein [Rubritalea tangerina]